MYTVHKQLTNRCIQCTNNQQLNVYSVQTTNNEMYTVHKQPTIKCIQCTNNQQLNVYSAQTTNN